MDTLPIFTLLEVAKGNWKLGVISLENGVSVLTVTQPTSRFEIYTPRFQEDPGTSQKLVE